MASATDLIRTSLLSFEMNFSFQLVTRLAILSRSSLKVLTLFLPSTIGKPKYFLNYVTIWALSILWIFSLTSIAMFGLKNKTVFCLFIPWPDACSYEPRMWSRWLQSDGMAGQNGRLSSANNKWEILIPFQQDIIPWMCCASIAFRSRAESPSKQNRNKYGDKGCPCFIPRDGEMKPRGSPLMSTK